MAKFSKIKNKELLLLNNLDILKKTLQSFLKEKNYYYNTSFKKAYLDKFKKNILK